MVATLWNLLGIPAALNNSIQLAGRAKDFWQRRPKTAAAALLLIVLGLGAGLGSWITGRLVKSAQTPTRQLTVPPKPEPPQQSATVPKAEPQQQPVRPPKPKPKVSNPAKSQPTPPSVSQSGTGNNQTTVEPGGSIQQNSNGPCSPNIVGSGVTTNCNTTPPDRHLTPKQIKALQAKSIRAVCTVSTYPDVFYDEMITILWEPTIEATNYAGEFIASLKPSVGLRKAFELDHKSSTGLFLGTTDWEHPDACATMLRLAFDASKIPYNPFNTAARTNPSPSYLLSAR